jgi:hypothetical protein
MKLISIHPACLFCVGRGTIPTDEPGHDMICPVCEGTGVAPLSNPHARKKPDVDWIKYRLDTVFMFWNCALIACMGVVFVLLVIAVLGRAGALP